MRILGIVLALVASIISTKVFAQGATCPSGFPPTSWVCLTDPAGNATAGQQTDYVYTFRPSSGAVGTNNGFGPQTVAQILNSLTQAQIGSLLAGYTFPALSAGSLSVASGGALAGTFTGTPTFSGNPAFTGTPTFANPLAIPSGSTIPNPTISGTVLGSPTYSGNPTYSGAVTFSGSVVLPTNVQINGTITGTPTWSGLNTFNAGATIAGGTLTGTFAGSPTFTGPLTISNLTASTQAVGTLSGLTATLRSLGTRASDQINVRDWGVIADGITDQTAAIQAIVNGFPSGSVIRLWFPRNAPPAQTTSYAVSGVVSSNGRIVHAVLEPGAYLTGSGYFTFDREEETLGFQKYTQAGNSNAFNLGTSLNVSYGYDTNIVNYSTGPNVNQRNDVFTDTRYFASNNTTPGGAAGGQLILNYNTVGSFQNLLDGTGISNGFRQLLGPQFNESQYDLDGLVSSQIFEEWDLQNNGINLPWTDQVGYGTPITGHLIASATGGNSQPWNDVVAGDVQIGYRIGGLASTANLGLAPTLDNRWPFYPALFGSQNPSAVTTSWSIVINGTTVTLNGGGGSGSLADVVASINAAGIANIQAQVATQGASSPIKRIVIYSTAPRDQGSITLANGTGTPLSALGLNAGTFTTAYNSGRVNAYAMAVSSPRTAGAQIVAQNAVLQICGVNVTLNASGSAGDFVSVANTINAANIVGVTASVSSWGGAQTRLVIRAFMAQQPNGLTLSNNGGSPLASIGMTGGTWFPPAPPHAWAIAASETVGSTDIFSTGDAVTLGYSLPISNTSQAGTTTAVVGGGSGSNGVANAALAINVAAVNAGWRYAPTLTANVGQGNSVFVLSSVAGLTIGMAAFDPAAPNGTGLFQPGVVIQDINTATNTVTTTGGPQSGMSIGATIWFGYIRADVTNGSGTGAALRVRNMIGGSMWVTDQTGTPVETMGMVPGQHWPGQNPASFQIAFSAPYNSIAAGGVGLMLGGAYSGLYADPVQYPGYPERVKYNWQHGTRTDEATFNDGNAYILGYGQSIAWGSPAQSKYKISVASNGTMSINPNGGPVIIDGNANTGSQNFLTVNNSGTVSTAGTVATMQTYLSAGVNTYFAMSSIGGASPITLLSSGSGNTGGIAIQSLAGPIDFIPATTLQINGVPGVTCAGAPTGAFASISGIVTHC